MIMATDNARFDVFFFFLIIQNLRERPKASSQGSSAGLKELLQLHIHSQLQHNHSYIIYSVLVATIDGLTRLAKRLRPP